MDGCKTDSKDEIRTEWINWDMIMKSNAIDVKIRLERIGLDLIFDRFQHTFMSCNTIKWVLYKDIGCGYSLNMCFRYTNFNSLYVLFGMICLYGFLIKFICWSLLTLFACFMILLFMLILSFFVRLHFFSFILCLLFSPHCFWNIFLCLILLKYPMIQKYSHVLLLQWQLIL